MAILLVLRGPEVGRQISLERDPSADVEEFVLGRDDLHGAHIVLPTHAVSRRHARIIREGNIFSVEDLKSRNNTYVNGEPLPPMIRRPLTDGDRLRICDHILIFLM